MALNEKFDARIQATRYYSKPSGFTVTNNVLMDTLQSLIAC